MRSTTSLLSLAVAVAAAGGAFAQELPTGGSVTSGSAEIVQSGSSLLVNQSSQNAIIAWKSFSVGGDASAHFENGGGATLNRVTGTLPSSIDGSLTATGSLYLVNQAGIAVGTGGMVRTGGSFIASTHDMTDTDFLDGGDITLKGSSKAAVVNKGFVASLSGDVVLTARRVENAGDMEAPNGSVGLLGGYEVLLRDTSLADGKFAVKVGGPDTEVVNSGTIRAAEVEMRTNGGSVQALAGNTKAIVKATGVKKVGGRIFLTAGSGGKATVTQKMVAHRAVRPAQRTVVASLPDAGPLPAARPDFAGGEVHVVASTVSLGGMIDATGAGAAGGTITATAAGGGLSLLSTAALDASGATGGLILLGGDYQGGSNPSTRYLDAPLARAATATVEAGATIAANGTAGDGGHVVVWSDEKTRFAGAISARGVGGKGGDAEVSGKAMLAYTGFADLSAANGAFGTLLLDPYNVTISNGTDTLGNGPAFTAGANDSVIDVGTLQTALAGASVTVSTGAGGGQAGDITVAAPITWSSGSTLSLDAWHSIAINAPVTIAGAGGLSLVTDHGGSGGTLSFAGGVQYTGTPGSGQSLAINGQNYELLYSMSNLQKINDGLNGRYALARSLDATGLTGWVPIGTDGAGTVLNSGNGFVGTFDGLGNTVSNMNVDNGNNAYAGLFGYSSGAISDIGLIGGSVKGSTYVGGLVGAQYGGSLARAYATGHVTGISTIGGLVGILVSASLKQAYATGQVTGNESVGGLVGGLGGGGVITQAYTTGAVTGASDVGGLVGTLAIGSVAQVYATGQITGNSHNVGGLVGYQYGGTIAQAHVTGQVIGPNSVSVGGLVGYQYGGTIASSYFDTYSSGQSTSKGIGNVANASGVTAVTSDPTQGAADAYKQSTYSSLSFTTTPGGDGWYMIDGQTRPFGAWEYSQNIVNAHQLQLVNMGLNAGYTLARNIDLAGEFGRAGVATPTAAQSAGMWNRGFVPLGTDGAGTRLNRNNGFAGSFNGGGHTISNLNVDIGGNNYAGLFGSSGGRISDIGLIGGAIKGGSYVGGLVGYIGGGSITRAYATGDVGGNQTVGGLVGQRSGGNIDQVYATGPVKGTYFVGGLIGVQTYGVLARAYATGSVEGTDYVGGLIGLQYGSIYQAYATGDVSGRYDVGGLVGQQADSDGRIEQAYAIGMVNGASSVGGLVGSRWNDNVIIDSYFDKFSTGQSLGVGYGSPDGVAILSSAPGTPGGESAFNKANYAGFDWTVWAPPSAAAGGSSAYYPQLYGVSGVVGVKVNNSGSQIYGEANPDYSGAINYFGLEYWNSLGVPVQVSTNATVHSNVGSNYSITASGGAAMRIQGGAARLIYLSDTGTFSVRPTTLSVTANAASKVYGDLDPTLSFTTSGFKLSDNTSILSGVLSRAAGENVGSYAIGQGSLSAGGNYTIAYTSANLAITPAALSVTANAASKVYGNLDPTLSFTASGFKLSDNISILSGVLSRAAGENVGSYAIGQGSLAAGGNYTIAYTGANLAVTPATLSVTATAASKVYGSLDPTLSFAAGGFKLSDNTSILSGVLSRAAGENVGSYAIGQGSLSAGGNYTIAYTGTNLAITPATLSVTANATSKVYGNLDPTLGFAASGFKLSDDTSILSGVLSRAAGENVGSYAIGQGSLSAGGNYTISFAASNLTITPATLTVSANAVSKVYGDADPTLSYTAGGFRFADNASLMTGNLARLAGENVGSHAIGQGSLLANANYTISFAASNLAITPAVLTVTANDGSMVYGNAVPGLSYSVSGWKNGQTDALLDGVTVTTDATSASNAGTAYVTTASGGALSDAAAGNYTVSYVGGRFLVTPRPITVAALGGASVYGDIPANPSLSAANLADGEDVTVLAGLSNSFGIGPTTGAGSHALRVAGTLTNANYTVTGTTGGIWTVAPRAITVRADDIARMYGDANPPLTWTVGGMGLVNGDTLAGSLATVSGGQTSAVGGYTIGQGSLATSPNYAMTFVGGMLMVTPRQVTVRADDQRRVQGQQDPALTWRLDSGSLAPFDTPGNVFSGSLVRAPGEGFGTYAIGQGSLAAGQNYSLAFVPGILTVLPAQYTGMETFERQDDGNGPLPRSGADNDGDDKAADGVVAEGCSAGVLGPECAAFIHPANRNLGPHIGMTE